MRGLIYIILVFCCSSCGVLYAVSGLPSRTHQTVEPIGETIAIDCKNRIAYVMFPCVEAPRERIPCGMIIQVNLDMYGETYLGEKRNIESPKQTFK